jgi:hypothetical protein
MARRNLLPTRADTYDVTVTINGIRFGTFDKMEGGDIDSEEYTYKPGAMAEPISMGGSRNVENVTVRRLYRLGRDHLTTQRLIDWVGKAEVVISKQPLDTDGNVFNAAPIVYTGTLKRVGFPDVDSESTDPGLFEIETTIDGMPTGASSA